MNCYAATETDHCRAYTLSHPGDQDYAIHCDHNPDDRCDRCSQFASVGGDIEEVLETAQCSVETKDELVFLKFRKVRLIGLASEESRGILQSRSEEELRDKWK